MEVSRIMAQEDLVSLDDGARREKINHTVRIIEAAGACAIAAVGVMTGPAPWDTSAPRVGVDISEGAALYDINYTGFCSVEFESFSYYEHVVNRDPEAAARISMEAICWREAVRWLDADTMLDIVEKLVQESTPHF